jgi:hypothetical protein
MIGRAGDLSSQARPARPVPTAGREIQQALGNPAADYQTVWESSAGGVAHLQEPSSMPRLGCLAIVRLLIRLGKDFFYRLRRITVTLPGRLGPVPLPALAIDEFSNASWSILALASSIPRCIRGIYPTSGSRQTCLWLSFP